MPLIMITPEQGHQRLTVSLLSALLRQRNSLLPNTLIILILILLSCSLSTAARAPHSSSITLQFRIDEEMPPGTLVGNISAHFQPSTSLTASSSLNHRSTLSRDTVTLARGRTVTPVAPRDLRFLVQKLAVDDMLLTLEEGTGLLRTARTIDSEEIHRFVPTCRRQAPVCQLPLRKIKVISQSSPDHIDMDMIGVSVTVVNINDNAPVFNDDGVNVDYYRLAIPESTPLGTVFSIPSADDPDSLDKLRYEMDHIDTFKLEVHNEVDGSQQLRLSLSQLLDREFRDSYSLRVVSHDDGSPPRSATLTVDVHVDDVNDNAPVLAQFHYNTTVNEDIPIGSSLVTVRAHDPDEGLNGKLGYALSSQSMASYGHVISVDVTSGLVHVTGSLDYERDDIMQVTVVVTDQGLNPQHAYAKVTIHLTDVNDNPPVIRVNPVPLPSRAEINGRNGGGRETLTFSGQVYENSPIDTLVSLVSVSDADTGDNGRVSCHLDSSHLFRLSVVSSEVTTALYKLLTAAIFDRENRNVEKVVLSCRDHGSPSLSTNHSILIQVLDMNDNNPTVSMGSDQIYVNIEENRDPSDLSLTLITLNVTDLDEGPAGQVVFRVVEEGVGEEGNEGRGVEVDDRGVVKAVVEFDYEQKRLHRYAVIISDLGSPARSTTVSLILSIIDVDDHVPRFDQASYSFHAPSTRPIQPGTPLGRVRAMDSDQSVQFNTVKYFIVADHPSGDGMSAHMTSTKMASNMTAVTSSHVTRVMVDVTTGEIRNEEEITGRAVNETIIFKVRACSSDDTNYCDVADITLIIEAMPSSGQDGTTRTLVLRSGRTWEVTEEEGEEQGSDVILPGVPDVSQESTFVLSPGRIKFFVAIGCAVVLVTVALVTAAACLAAARGRRMEKRKNNYNCRLEADKALSVNSLQGRVSGASESSSLMGGACESDGQLRCSPNSGSAVKSCMKNRKEVKFMLEGGLGGGVGRGCGNRISSPITDNRLICSIPDDCIMHSFLQRRHQINHTPSSSEPIPLDDSPALLPSIPSLTGKSSSSTDLPFPRDLPSPRGCYSSDWYATEPRRGSTRMAEVQEEVGGEGWRGSGGEGGMEAGRKRGAVDGGERKGRIVGALVKESESPAVVNTDTRLAGSLGGQRLSQPPVVGRRAMMVIDHPSRFNSDPRLHLGGLEVAGGAGEGVRLATVSGRVVHTLSHLEPARVRGGTGPRLVNNNNCFLANIDKKEDEAMAASSPGSNRSMRPRRSVTAINENEVEEDCEARSEALSQARRSTTESRQGLIDNEARPSSPQSPTLPQTPFPAFPLPIPPPSLSPSLTLFSSTSRPHSSTGHPFSLYSTSQPYSSTSRPCSSTLEPIYIPQLSTSLLSPLESHV